MTAVLPQPSPSGFLPRIGVRGMLSIAGMTLSAIWREPIPDRSPGHAFIAIAHHRLVPAHQGMKSGMWFGTGESARWILLRTPTPAGDKPPRYIFSFRLIGLQFGTWRAGIKVDWRAHPGSGPGCAFVPIAGAGTPRGLVVGSVWVWLVPPFPSGFPPSRE